MILSPLFLALPIALVSRDPIPAVTAISDGVANLFRDVLSRVALAVFVTLLLLVMRLIVLSRYQGFQ